MISRNIITDILMIGFFVALQTFVLNDIRIFGTYTPVVYPSFILFYPFFRNKYIFLALSFLLGIGVDAFLGTWGINASASVVIAYFRTIIFRTSTEVSTDFFSFHSLQWTQFLLFIFTSLFTHQLLVQYIEFFKFSRILEIFFNVLITSVVSFIFVFLYVLIFRIKQKV